jgi:hypothetical protein
MSWQVALVLAAAPFAICLATTAVARADDTSECLAASDTAQNERDAGRLSQARKHLLVCSREVCPAVVRKYCEQWLRDVDERIPTIVFAARDSHGAAIADATVLVDGAIVTTRLDGAAMPMDPGEHRLRITHEGSQPLEQVLVAREHEQGRRVQVEFPPPPPLATGGAPVQGSHRTSLAAASVLGGVGALALGGSAYFAISGAADASDLRQSCAPMCSESSVSALRRKLLVADLAFGAGVVSLAVASYLVFVAVRDQGPPRSPRVSVDFVPGARGQVAVLSGAF